MPPTHRKKVLLIGWDAADWKVINPLMDSGKMPNIQRLIENGSMAQLATLHPPLSPMLWTSIATGKRPFKHGIHGFTELTPGGQGVQPVTNLSRKCKAVWNIFNQNDIRSTVIGWWPSHPAEPLNGVTVSDHYHRANAPIKGKTGPLHEIWPLLPGTIHPPRLAEKLGELRFHPDDLVPAMVEPFIPKMAEIDQDKDRRLAGMMKTLCECVSIHSAATWLIENEPWDFFAVYYDAIDHFCHGFMKYRAPRQEWISERDFDLYQNVVTQAYQLHDQMLGTLLEKARQSAGEELTVILISDHGFHPDHLRPRAIPDMPAGPAIEHSDFGIFVASGPGIKKDELLYGASVIDITPTLLALYGLPAGEDMDGKVLSGVFLEKATAVTIPSWDEIPGEDGRHPPHLELDPVAAREAMEQMIALGYIERPDEDKDKAIENTVRELRYNLAEAYQDDARHHEAADILRELYGKDPDEQRYAVRYFVSCQALGMIGEMRRIVDDLDGRRRALYEGALLKAGELREIARTRAVSEPDPDTQFEPLLSEDERKEFAKWRNLTRYQPPLVDYLKGQILTAEKRYAEALLCLERVTEAHLARPGLLLQTGDLYRKLGRFREARLTYQEAARIDPDNPHAHLGLCRMALRRKRWDRAAVHALNCLQRLYHYPLAHFLLGMALTGMESYDRAAEAFRVAISLNPNFPAAHRRLAAVLDEKLNDPEGAKNHRQLFLEIRRKARRPLRTKDRSSLPARAAQSTVEISLPFLNMESAKPLEDSVVIVSGLPRSGTSMVMQMLAAGGVPVLSDGVRQADEDNPRGYLEFEPARKLFQNSDWLKDAKGKAVKIVAPLLAAVPPGIACRVILIERDFDEILDSQAKMIERRGGTAPDTLDRRELLKAEYARTISRARQWLRKRPETAYLILDRASVLVDADYAAARIAEFLDGHADSRQMAAAVDVTLHRNRKTVGAVAVSASLHSVARTC